MSQLITDHPLFCFAVVAMLVIAVVELATAFINRNKPIVKCRTCSSCDEDHLFDDEEDEHLDED